MDRKYHISDQTHTLRNMVAERGLYTEEIRVLCFILDL